MPQQSGGKPVNHTVTATLRIDLAPYVSGTVLAAPAGPYLAGRVTHLDSDARLVIDIANAFTAADGVLAALADALDRLGRPVDVEFVGADPRGVRVFPRLLAEQFRPTERLRRRLSVRRPS